jgi:hypothetical protein
MSNPVGNAVLNPCFPQLNKLLKIQNKMPVITLEHNPRVINMQSGQCKRCSIAIFSTLVSTDALTSI